MFESLSVPLLTALFAAAAIGVWIAGIHLSNSTDVLAARWGLGEALGGLILLALVTNLPEVAITVSGAVSHNLSIAVGNILGGIAIQTVVLVVLDVVGLGKSAPLTYQVASLTAVLEGLLVIAVLTVSVIGTQLPATLIFARVTPSGLLIAILWLGGLWLIGKSRTSLPWTEKGCIPDGHQKSGSQESIQNGDTSPKNKVSTTRSVTVFVLAGIVTLVCGVVLEQAGDAIAKHVGMTGVLFGATVLAAATSLPELSTGLASMKLGDHRLAVSDIFGGNAFLPVLFLVASLISGQAVLPRADSTDIYLTALAILLTVVYVVGLIFRPRLQIARMGIDSFMVSVFYIVGLCGLIAISRS
jgi:cation:H+ antiporter